MKQFEKQGKGVRDMNTECNADLGHPCDASNGEPCASCQAAQDYWRRAWERYGRREVASRPTREEVMDAYSDPTEYQKKERLLREIEW